MTLTAEFPGEDRRDQQTHRTMEKSVKQRTNQFYLDSRYKYSGEGKENLVTMKRKKGYAIWVLVCSSHVYCFNQTFRVNKVFMLRDVVSLKSGGLRLHVLESNSTLSVSFL